MRKKIIFIVFSNLLSLIAISQNWVNFNTSNGLFNNQAMTITKDKFNVIWVGMNSGGVGYGLDKFDGNNWTHYDSANSALPEDDVNVLNTDTLGNLWMSFNGSGGPYFYGLTKFDGVNWTTYDTTNSGVLSNHVYDIQVDKRNNLWLACKVGISKFDGISFTNYNTWPLMVIKLLVEDSSSIWFTTQNAGLAHFNPITDSLIVYNQSNSNIPSIYSSAIGKDKNGLIWVGFNLAFTGGIGNNGGSNGGLATFDGTSFTAIWPFTNHYTGVYGLAIDTNNNVWVSTRCEGLYKFDGVSWSQIQGVPTNGCSYDVYVDKENYIWYCEVYSGVWTNDFQMGIPEYLNEDKIRIYPNPAKSTIIIQIQSKLKNEELEITDVLGNTIYHQTLNKTNTTIDVSGFSNGVYFCRVSNDKEISSGKFVIMR